MEPARVPSPRPTFPTMDGYRAIAAVGVAIYHTTISVSFQRGDRSPAWNAPLGSFGVTIFFLLSGFLLYRPFVAAHLADRPAPRLLPFWERRAARIFPAYWLALIGLFVVLRQAPAGGFLDWLTYAGLAQTYRKGMAVTGLEVAWTLCIELSFYLVLPLLAAIAGRLGRGRSADGKLAVQVGLVVAMAAIGVGYRIVVLVHRPSWAEGWIEPRYWLPFTLDWFALGMLLAVISAATAGRALPRALDLLAQHPEVCVVLAALGYWWMVVLSPARQLGGAPAATDVTMARLSLQGLTAFVLLIPGVFRPNTTDPWRRFLRWKPVVHVGLVSYGVYLWHTMVVHWLRDQIKGDGWFPASIPLAVVVVVGVSVAVATVSYRFVERPVLDAVARRQSAARAAVQPPARTAARPPTA